MASIVRPAVSLNSWLDAVEPDIPLDVLCPINATLTPKQVFFDVSQLRPSGIVPRTYRSSSSSVRCATTPPIDHGEWPQPQWLPKKGEVEIEAGTNREEDCAGSAGSRSPVLAPSLHACVIRLPATATVRLIVRARAGVRDGVPTSVMRMYSDAGLLRTISSEPSGLSRRYSHPHSRAIQELIKEYRSYWGK